MDLTPELKVKLLIGCNIILLVVFLILIYELRILIVTDMTCAGIPQDDETIRKICLGM